MAVIATGNGIAGLRVGGSFLLFFPELGTSYAADIGWTVRNYR